MSDNVVLFPGVGPVTPQTLDQIKANVQNVYKVHVDDSMECLFEVVFMNTTLLGYAFDDERFDKDIAMVAEALRSLLYKFWNIDHPFQRQATETFEIDKEGVTRFVGDAEVVLEPASGEE